MKAFFCYETDDPELDTDALKYAIIHSPQFCDVMSNDVMSDLL